MKLKSSFFFLINEKYLSTGSFKGGKHINPRTFKFSFSHSATSLSRSFKFDPPGTGLKSTQQLTIDWSRFENHTFFNSAEAKVNTAFDMIINNYPFDGSRTEIEEFKTLFEKIFSEVSKNISGTSNIVSKFEESFQKLVGKKYCTAVSNGSVALDLALQSLNLNQDDEVILPSFTIVSCLSAILRTGAKPVFCDVDLYSWNMTYENVISKYTKKSLDLSILLTTMKIT